MKYFTFHINDSGALEYEKEVKENNSTILLCKMYKDDEFNRLNDILFSSHNNGIVLNDHALKIFSSSNLPKYKILKASVSKKEKLFNTFSFNKHFNYNYLKFEKESFDKFYRYIDFVQSDIWVLKSKARYKKLDSHKERLSFIEKNRTLKYAESFSFTTNKIVFDKNFDQEIDLFRIPYYSSGIYVSERIKKKIESNQLTDVRFASDRDQLNNIWQPFFPEIIIPQK